MIKLKDCKKKCLICWGGPFLSEEYLQISKEHRFKKKKKEKIG